MSAPTTTDPTRLVTSRLTVSSACTRIRRCRGVSRGGTERGGSPAALWKLRELPWSPSVMVRPARGRDRRWRCSRVVRVRLVIARCHVDYVGRLTAHLPMAPRLLLVKADGSVSVHADDRAYKPLNWMSPPCWLRGRAATGGVDGDATRPTSRTA